MDLPPVVERGIPLLGKSFVSIKLIQMVLLQSPIGEERLVISVGKVTSTQNNSSCFWIRRGEKLVLAVFKHTNVHKTLSRLVLC